VIGAQVHDQRLDVTDRTAVLAYADSVAAEYGVVNIVVNNAGIAFTGDVEEMTFENIERVMDVDFWGVVNGTKAFLPHLRASGEGHIVNVSSVFGLISVPTQSAYNAAKFGVRGFTDALRMELEIDGGNVSCTTVHPGGIKTNIARNARMDDSVAALTGESDSSGQDFDKVAMTTPEKAARQILTAVERNKRRALIGPDAKVVDLISRLPAGVYQRVMIAGAKRGRRRSATESAPTDV
jgi:butyryl-CoA dehydrogenase